MQPSSAVGTGPIGNYMYCGCCSQLLVSICSVCGILWVYDQDPIPCAKEGIALSCNFPLQLWQLSRGVERLPLGNVGLILLSSLVPKLSGLQAATLIPNLSWACGLNLEAVWCCRTLAVALQTTVWELLVWMVVPSRAKAAMAQVVQSEDVKCLCSLQTGCWAVAVLGQNSSKRGQLVISTDLCLSPQWQDRRNGSLLLLETAWGSRALIKVIFGR